MTEARPVRIALLDTGVNPQRSHVNGGVTGSVCFRPREGRLVAHDEPPRDLVGHGTALAGMREGPYGPDGKA